MLFPITAYLSRRVVPGLLLLFSGAVWIPAATGAVPQQGAELGLTLRPDPDRHGYLVTAVTTESVAEAPGLRRGDVLVDAIVGGPPVTLCPDEPAGPSNLRLALSSPATHLGRLRPGAPQHEQFQRVDIRQAVATVARQQ